MLSQSIDTVTAELVHKLITNREGPLLDFKLTTYNWENDGNRELIKDTISIANTLVESGPCGYILFGVVADANGYGVLRGIDPTKHLDDAIYQQKLGSTLNRKPTFSYSAVTVDGFGIGVIEIRPGGRPYYSLKPISGNIPAKVAPYRSGSSTDTASPDMILRWAQEDTPIKHWLSLAAEELAEFLQLVTYKTYKPIRFYPDLIRPVRAAFQVTQKGMMNGNILDISTDNISRLAFFSFWGKGPYELNLSALEQLSITNALSERNEGKSYHVPSKFQISIRHTLRLISRILSDRYEDSLQRAQKGIIELSYKTKHQTVREVREFDMVTIFTLAEQMDVAICQSMNLLAYIYKNKPLVDDPRVYFKSTSILADVPTSKDETSTEEALTFIRDKTKSL